MKQRYWTPGELAVLRRDYCVKSKREIAAELNRPLCSIWGKASALGLSRPQRINAPGFETFFREKHALGWSDSAIAKAWGGTDRHAVSRMRKRLGLASNLHCKYQREQVKKKTREQLRKAGLKSLAYLRFKVWRDRARAEGWPEELKPRQVEIMNLLWENGPMAREQIGQALGMRKKKRSDGRRLWYPMLSNKAASETTGATWLSDLMKRGLVIDLGRIETGHGPGGNRHVYSLPLGIQRGARKEA